MINLLLAIFWGVLTGLVFGSINPKWLGFKSRKYVFGIFGGAIFVIFALLVIITGSPKNKTLQIKPNNALTLITEPDDGMTPLISMIQEASTSVDLVMYELDDPNIENALYAAKKRGVAVRVLLNQGYYGQQSPANEPAYQYFHSNNIPVKWSPSYFALTHQKTLIVDDKMAVIMTFNLFPQFYSTSRDFGIIDKDQNDVSAIENAFTGDWQGTQITASNADDLMWSPDSENATIAIINDATSSLEIYNEEMSDGNVINALISAAQRGVTVDVDMSYENNWKSAFQRLSIAGVHIRTYATKASLYIHAKMIIADGTQAFIGSENFSATSLNNNRELGIVIVKPEIIASLNSTFQTDWKNAAPF